jgi:hypothetical protein
LEGVLRSTCVHELLELSDHDSDLERFEPAMQHKIILKKTRVQNKQAHKEEVQAIRTRKKEDKAISRKTRIKSKMPQDGKGGRETGRET